mmetsp:Transcript_96412/g.152487  ORF Transcript_96412/g.152487 Transcript_96412/m.152487 type:complete len:601 (+) Transcript_96412:51-1853(+)
MKISLHGQLAPTTFLSCIAFVFEASAVSRVGTNDAQHAENLLYSSGASVVEKEIPEVYHNKHPGGSYKRGSPLYDRQEAIASGIASPPSSHISTTMKCIIFLIAQFFAVYTMLFLVQTAKTCRPNGFKFTRLERVLMGVTKTVNMIPTLCVLFLATRMRAVQLTKGMTDLYNLPQWWVRLAMVLCAVAHMLRAATYAVSRALPNSSYGDTSLVKSPMKVQEKALKLAFFVFTAIHHVSFMVVCIGLCTMPAPKELWGLSGGPKASVAVSCTIILLTLFFVVHFCIDVCQNLDDLTSRGYRFSRWAPTNIFRDMPDTVDIIPMLCVIFISARIRSWQLSGDEAESWPEFAKTAAYVATLSVFTLVLLNLGLAVLRRKEPLATSVQIENEGPTKISTTKLGNVLNLVRLAMLLTLCGSAVVIVVALYMFRLSYGITPVLPSSIQCVLYLTGLYFFFYLLKYKLETIQLYVGEVKQKRIQRLLKFLEDHSKKAIDFCPVLSVLFLATFLRALQVTDGKGAPQRWAQDAMYVATWALIFMTIARVDSLLFPKTIESTMSWSQTFFRALLTISMFFLHFAVFAIIVAVFSMTPANAHGRGSVEVI